ncbi:MAG: threonine/serine dehydratase [Pseudomonadota bacterium]
MSYNLPSRLDLEDAVKTLAPVVRETPLLRSRALDAIVGCNVLVKPESLQQTGSFKLRGAYYRLSRLNDDERRRGVVAFSSGNFAQGLAAAGSILEVPVTIVMPIDAPKAKIDATRGWGAAVELTAHGDEPREVVADRRAREIAKETGAILAHPFDDPMIVAGQSTVTVELLRQAKELGAKLDVILVPVGGGGLLGGCALACEHLDPGPKVYAVEPAGYDDFGRSLELGERISNSDTPKTLCDALQAVRPGEITFAAAYGRVEGGVAVEDNLVRNAMKLAFDHLKIVLEPSGAITLGAILGGTLDLQDKTVAVLSCGGNVALEDFIKLVA